MQLSHSRCVITGGASGLGATTAKAFRNAGAEVMLFDLEASGGAGFAPTIGAGFQAVDVTNEASVSAGIVATKAAMGGIDVLVNCAGIAIGERTVGREGPHALASFQRTVDINLIGTFNCLRLVAAEMAQRSAAIAFAA